MGDGVMDQLDTADRLIDTLNEEFGSGRDLSQRDLIEAMGMLGLVFAPGDQQASIVRMDEIDKES